VQSIFYPLEMYAKRREGISLSPIVRGPSYQGRTNGQVNFVDASAILNQDRLHVFLTNRSLNEPAVVHIKVEDHELSSLDGAELVTGPNAQAANSFEHPDLIQSQPFAELQIRQDKVTTELPPLSVVAMTFALA
jgi:alpha-L-arabinofuranosidase